MKAMKNIIERFWFPVILLSVSILIAMICVKFPTTNNNGCVIYKVK